MAEVVTEGKKELGAYYTPDKAAGILVQWVIRDLLDVVLEPGFGQCGFIQAAIQRLKELGSTDPFSQIYGCDVDQGAIDWLRRHVADGREIAERFIRRDFLKVRPLDFSPNRFQAVVGNPPYVSYHNMSDEQRQNAKAVLQQSEFSLDRKASLWAYFVLHALDFLAEGGRIAWVLPGTLFHSDYAETVSNAVAENFERALAIQLGERLFVDEGTEESSVILLASGWRTGEMRRGLEVGYASSLDELEEKINAWESGEWQGRSYDSRIGSVLMAPEVADAMKRVEEQCQVVKFEDVANIKIGIVTGANRFFIVSQAIADEHSLEGSDLKVIFSKSKIAEGISVTEADLKSAREKGLRCLLINTEAEISDALQAYLDQWSEEEIESNVTFGKRDPWHQPDDGDTPDAFFPYMQHVGPRLVLNDCGVNSTNTIHRVYFCDTVSKIQQQLVAVSLLSTYSQLSAELEGRMYGSGVLKHELSETRAIQLILPQNADEKRISVLFQHVDNLLRQEKREHARQEADKFLLSNLPQPDRHCVVQALEEGLERARKRRKVTES